MARPATTDASTESSDSATGVDAANVDAGCGVTFAQEGGIVVAEVIIGAPPPHLLGGTIVPGVYVLRKYRLHNSFATGTAEVRETLRVRGAGATGTFDRLTEIMNVAGTFKAIGPTGSTTTWTRSFPTVPLLDQSVECPTKSPIPFSTHFAADGNFLVIFADDIERVYERIR